MAADGRLPLDKLSGAGAATGNVPVWSGTRWTPGSGAGIPIFDAVVKQGPAGVATNVFPAGVYVPTACTVSAVYVRVGTAPTGSSLTVVVKDGGTTVATVSVASGATSGSSTGLSYALSAGDVLTYDITAVGSTTPGWDVGVAVVVA